MSQLLQFISLVVSSLPELDEKTIDAWTRNPPRVRRVLRDAFCPIFRDRRKELLSQSIEELGFSVRLRDCCRDVRVYTLGELIQRSGEELLKQGFGKVPLRRLRERLAEIGQKLRDD